MGFRRTVSVVLLVCAARAIAGCAGEESPGPAASVPTTSVPPPAGSPPASSPAQPPGEQPAGTATAAKCTGKPTAADVLSELKKVEEIAVNSGTKVTVGPLCWGDWQFTVALTPGYDPVQVLTRLVGGKLTVVAAGTEICDSLAEADAPPPVRPTHC